MRFFAMLSLAAFVATIACGGSTASSGGSCEIVASAYDQTKYEGTAGWQCTASSCPMSPPATCQSGVCTVAE